MMNHLDTGTVRIVLADENVLVPVRMGLFNVIIWRAMFVFGIQPSFEDFENVKVAKSKIINNVRLTKVYNKLIRCLPNVPHPLILREICFTVDYFNHWIRRYIGHYMPAIDEMSMSKLTQNPELAALMNTTFNDTVDTRVVELRHKKVGADVVLTHDNGEYIENPYHHEPDPETGMPKDPAEKTEKFKKSMTYQYVGLQTDYTDGGGILPVPMIEALLQLGLKLD